MGILKLEAGDCCLVCAVCVRAYGLAPAVDRLSSSCYFIWKYGEKRREPMVHFVCVSGSIVNVSTY
jgi:hypothetical protein